jgi:hypothetical protein
MGKLHLFQSVDEISIKLFMKISQRDSRYSLRQWSLLEQTFTVIERQSSCVSNFGLLIIELPLPSVMVANYGKTVATVYDATYGFQINIFRKSCLA